MQNYSLMQCRDVIVRILTSGKIKGAGVLHDSSAQVAGPGLSYSFFTLKRLRHTGIEEKRPV